MSNVESVGTIQAMYTVEPNPDDASTAIVTYWLANGTKIGSMTVKRSDEG